MPFLDFDDQFASAVESGAKRQTIRARRRDIGPGSALTLVNNFGGPNARRLHAAQVPCARVTPVVIQAEGVLLAGAALKAEDLPAFAKADGFSTWQHMLSWFSSHYGLPFEGILIQW